MKMTMVVFHLIVLTADVMLAQTGDHIYRRAGVLDGNSTQTVFGNWGVIG